MSGDHKVSVVVHDVAGKPGYERALLGAFLLILMFTLFTLLLLYSFYRP